MAWLAYCEHFHLDPAAHDSARAVWFTRWRELTRTRRLAGVRDAVERHGLGQVSTDDRRAYNDLMLWLKDNGA